METCGTCHKEVMSTEVSPVWFEEYGYGDIPDSAYICTSCVRKEERELAQMEADGEL